MNLKRILAGALAVACVSSVNVFAADTTSKTGFSDVNESTAEGQAELLKRISGHNPRQQTGLTGIAKLISFSS